MNNDNINSLDLTTVEATSVSAKPLDLTFIVRSVELVRFKDHDMVAISCSFPVAYWDKLPWAGEKNLARARESAEATEGLKKLTFMAETQAYVHERDKGIESQHPFPVIYGEWRVVIGSCFVDRYNGKDGNERNRWMCRDFIPQRPKDPDKQIDIPDPLENLNVRDYRTKKDEEPKRDETDDIK